jgi:hypothetical protein
MGEMDEDLFDDFDEAVEIHLMNSLNFTESTVEELKIKCCIQKAYVNRDFEFNAFLRIL